MNSFIKIDDFRDDHGVVDWGAYRQAELENGQVCYQCNGIAGLFGCGHRRLCYACKEFEREHGEVTHGTYVWCPKCGHRDEWEDEAARYTEGEHDVLCGACEYQYTIQTEASYSYTSPARLENVEPTT